jgi:nitrite reductase/ring-hydroxylating ferredoxin subunit
VTPDSTPAIAHISAGHDPDPALSMSLHADAYTDPKWFDVDQRAIFARTWQWLCHAEKLREPGSYVTGTVTGMPTVAVRDETGALRAFYNVCKHRAHELLSGSGVRRSIVCPYHAWNFDLAGRLRRARGTGAMPGFDLSEVRLDQIQVIEFAGMVYVNLDPEAAPLPEQAGEPDEAEPGSIRYIDEVLQVEDIALVESVQRGMRTPAFSQGKIVYDPDGSGLSEHAVHHFHGLVLDAYRHELARSRDRPTA